MRNMQLIVTLWPGPEFPHFERFANDDRLSGVRMNSAKVSSEQFTGALDEIRSIFRYKNQLGFDVKGRQLRITDVKMCDDHLEVVINHPIRVDLPTPVLFKGAIDEARLVRIEDDGRRLIFDDFPEFMVEPGESIHIHHPSLISWGSQFTDSELLKLEIARDAGFKVVYLSYVQNQRDVDQCREIVGRDVLIRLKIEDKKGLEYVANEFRKKDNLELMAARGDLVVEVKRLSAIVPAMKLIIEKDPEACAASRILLSVQTPQLSQCKRAVRYALKHHPSEEKAAEIMNYLFAPQPASCADFCELTWLADIGYRKFMLCDELCLHENLLEEAINAFEEFSQTYVPQRIIAPLVIPNPARSESTFGNIFKRLKIS